MSVCTIHIRVRYGETDQMGVAHHGAYVNWLESGRVAYCRELGVPYSEVEQAGFNMAVADMQIRYKKPALFDQVLSVETTAEQVRSRFLKFRYRVLNEAGELLVEATTTHVVVGRDLKQASLTPSIMDRLKGTAVADA